MEERKQFNNDIQTNTRPNIPTTRVKLPPAYFANSMNAGHHKPVHYKYVMAGEKMYSYKMKINIKMLTPKTPVFQNLRFRARLFYVPHSRVWTNWNKFFAQKGDSTVTKIQKIPHTDYWEVPWVGTPSITGSGRIYTPITNTTNWRDSWVSTYFPRVGQGYTQTAEPQELSFAFPDMSILPARGYIAIYNDYLRDKRYDEEAIEWKGDEVYPAELDNYNPTNIGEISDDYRYSVDFFYGRANRDKSYYNDYHTEPQGFGLEAPTTDTNSGFVDTADWLAKVNEARQQVENQNKTDWEIMSELRGSKPLTEGVISFLGETTFNLNYASITQSSYNTNEDIELEFQAMGTQGAYSYTEAIKTIAGGIEYKEDGYLHLIVDCLSMSLYENGVDRTSLAINWDEIYRPDLKNKKLDVIYAKELTTSLYQNAEDIIGYNRAWNYYFKMPNCLGGDLMSSDWEGTVNKNIATNNGFVPEKVITNKTFQFFEPDPFKRGTTFTEGNYKKIWKDYSDLNVNKNLAIKYKIEAIGENEFMINGQNQIFFMGEIEYECELPIERDAENNFTNYGEL